MKSLQDWIEDYKLENIFPAHYFDKLQVKSFSPGQAICQQGEDLRALSYFIKGKIKIVRRLFNGKEHILDIQDKPTLIGDIELLTKQKTVSSVMALEKAWVIQLPLPKNKEALLTDPSFLLKLGQGLAQALYDQNVRAATNLSYTVKERLATHILAVQNQGFFRLELATLADSFGVSYRHLLRVIQEFIKQGLIGKQKPYYHIRDKKQLSKWQIKD
ncbi:cyclic nucleotide-binding domain-containing protein [Streptococcus macacae]|uniref:Regulatory protein nsr n=1 Tax=Streptococcus macacae NCTC 11558 TaxID=764298 RepID=G5JV41_9STRE|nr:cyclic nucleotide-binding domain-containing protein [Streptococcus macacae]EHJ51753.1 putative regulatory protein nsr [Streptococcus macacae NCTC 11558]SUN77667.1 transcriptional regulator [Streptococcus macacae NCTC 11558]